MDSAYKTNTSSNEYGFESDDGVVGLVPYGFNSDSDDSYELPSTSKQRNKRVRVKNCTWFDPINKKRREQGKSYFGRQNEGNHWNYKNIKERRTMKERCNCNKSVTMKCESITDTDRQKVFTEFWQMSWSEKKIFVNTLIQTVPCVRPRNRKAENKSKRSRTLQYYLKVNNTNIRVCKTFFINTLGIGRQTVIDWAKKPLASSISLKKTAPKISNITEERQCLSLFFDSLPSLESHYCRARTNKKYLLAEWGSKQKLYEFYVNDWCCKKEIRPLSISVFFEMFDVKNLALFSPKKDQCEKCAKYSVGNLSQEEYTIHQKKKEDARNEKNKDKAEETHVYTVDLQAVLMAPKSQVSSLYYRTKLQVHNLVFYNIKNQKAYCFLWNEVEGGLGAEEFASIWTYFIEKKVLCGNENPGKLIFYSDGCTYQNRNCVMSNALLNIAIKQNIMIEQKILEIGHTQMEADSVHSSIERAIRNRNIDVPAEYISICKTARKKPEPYDVTYLDYSFFKNFKNVQFFKSIRPGNGKGDPKVTDIRGIKYTPNSEIYFKLTFSDDWKILPQRINTKISALEFSNLQQLYLEKRKITAKKYEDLQYLKSTLPKDHHQFYDNLPHQ